jgi:glycosyltransferase involved in cell wall biosynthesis
VKDFDTMRAPAKHVHRAGRVELAVSGLSLNIPHTGTGRYARHVIEYVSKQPDFNTRLLADGELPGGFGRANLGSAQFVKVPIPRLARGSYAHKLLWEQVALSVATRRLEANVLYAPHFSIPLFRPCQSIVSIHDVIPLTDPAYARGLPAKLYFRLVSAAARNAAAVITLSQFARAEIERILEIPGHRIHVVSPGVDDAFSPVPDPAREVAARRRYGLPERYVLYVGGADARKNIGVLLESAARLRDMGGAPAIVIAAGLPKPGQPLLFPDWREQARRLVLSQDHVRFIERIAEEDLPHIYRSAEAFAFPSRDEGFGLPPLEAMASGTPVLSSNASSLPEAVGDAGLLLPPDDIEAWTTALARITTDAGLRRRLSAASIARASRFQWQATGARVADIIRTVDQCAY